MNEALDEFAKLVEGVRKDDPNRCTCDFCSGKKRTEDNWCPYCGEVQMSSPKWWENMDVCDACEQKLAAERSQERIFTDAERALLNDIIPKAGPDKGHP